MMRSSSVPESFGRLSPVRKTPGSRRHRENLGRLATAALPAGSRTQNDRRPASVRARPITTHPRITGSAGLVNVEVVWTLCNDDRRTSMQERVSRIGAVPASTSTSRLSWLGCHTAEVTCDRAASSADWHARRAGLPARTREISRVSSRNRRPRSSSSATMSSTSLSEGLSSCRQRSEVG